jgi:hypothetical protein
MARRYTEDRFYTNVKHPYSWVYEEYLAAMGHLQEDNPTLGYYIMPREEFDQCRTDALAGFKSRDEDTSTASKLVADLANELRDSATPAERGGMN